MLVLAVWSVKPAIQSIWGIGVLAVLVHAAFDYPFSRPAVGAWPVVILAMTVAGYAPPQQLRLARHQQAQ